MKYSNDETRLLDNEIKRLNDRSKQKVSFMARMVLPAIVLFTIVIGITLSINALS